MPRINCFDSYDKKPFRKHFHLSKSDVPRMTYEVTNEFMPHLICPHRFQTVSQKHGLGFLVEKVSTMDANTSVTMATKTTDKQNHVTISGANYTQHCILNRSANKLANKVNM